MKKILGLISIFLLTVTLFGCNIFTPEPSPEPEPEPLPPAPLEIKINNVRYSDDLIYFSNNNLVSKYDCYVDGNVYKQDLSGSGFKIDDLSDGEHTLFLRVTETSYQGDYEFKDSDLFTFSKRTDTYQKSEKILSGIADLKSFIFDENFAYQKLIFTDTYFKEENDIDYKLTVPAYIRHLELESDRGIRLKNFDIEISNGGLIYLTLKNMIISGHNTTTDVIKCRQDSFLKINSIGDYNYILSEYIAVNGSKGSDNPTGNGGNGSRGTDGGNGINASSIYISGSAPLFIESTGGGNGGDGGKGSGYTDGHVLNYKPGNGGAGGTGGTPLQANTIIYDVGIKVRLEAGKGGKGGAAGDTTVGTNKGTAGSDGADGTTSLNTYSSYKYIILGSYDMQEKVLIFPSNLQFSDNLITWDSTGANYNIYINDELVKSNYNSLSYEFVPESGENYKIEIACVISGGNSPKSNPLFVEG